MKNLIKVSKSGRSISVNGNQISNFSPDGNHILPRFLESFGTIEIDCEISEFINSKQFKDLQFAYKSNKQSRKISNQELAYKIEQKKAADNAMLQRMILEGPIPCTVNNVRMLLQFLNDQNWGVWVLPKMTIGYSAAQHDCDGHIATTIKLDSAISDKDFGVENEKMFKIGGKKGYLIKYLTL
jgi:hypothetical protein